MKIRCSVSAALGAVALLIVSALIPQNAYAGLYPTNKCVSKKLTAAAVECKLALLAWSKWDKLQDDAKRDEALLKAGTKLADKWEKAELSAQAKGVDCAETTLSSSEMEADIKAMAADIVASINTGLSLADNSDHRKCGSKLLKAAAVGCMKMLKAESKYIKRAAKDPLGAGRDADRQKASDKFGILWGKAGACPTAATQTTVEAAVDALCTYVVDSTANSPNVPDNGFLAITHPDPNQPGHEVEYEGDTLRPRCQDSSAYTFFAKRGTENKLLMYYEGGGACWDTFTCCLELCKQDVNPASLPLGESV
jgi:hypothetical protein